MRSMQRVPSARQALPPGEHWDWPDMWNGDMVDVLNRAMDGIRCDGCGYNVGPVLEDVDGVERPVWRFVQKSGHNRLFCEDCRR